MCNLNVLVRCHFRDRRYRAILASKALIGEKQVQAAQLSHRDRAAGYISFGQKWKTRTGRQYNM